MDEMTVNTGGTAAEKIGRFVEKTRPETVAPEVVRQASRSFLDTLGISLAARDEEAGRIAVDYATKDRCGGPSTLWSTGEKAQPEDAALVNGILAHALDYDHVTAKPGRGHPAVVLWPAVIALGEPLGATGRQVSTAFAVGYEFFMKLQLERVFDHYARGHHSTSTLGLIAGAAACANLLQLDAERTTMAVGMAASHASGLQANFGTMTKPLHAGNAAAASIRCTQLAARGYTASADALESAQGFAGAYTMDDLGTQTEGLGKDPLELGTLGFSVKKFACCLSVHVAVQTILDMLAERPIDPAEVERIRVAVEPRGLKALIHHRPTTGLQGKFSMEYCVAAALIDGAMRLESFTDDAVQRPEAQALLRKVDAREDEGEARPLRAAVEIELKSGERLAKKLDKLPGSPQQPLTDAELEQKFRDCVAFSGLEFDVDGLIAATLGWQDRPVGSILAMVSKA